MLFFNSLDIIPAYGRVYENMEEVKEDWDAGKDFRIINGPYCSKRDSKFMKEQGTKELKFFQFKPFVIDVITLE